MRNCILTLAALAAVQVSAIVNLDAGKTVGICYSVWHSLGFSGSTPNPDISNIEAGSGAYGPVSQFHWWGHPEIGYYGGSNRDVLARHFAQIHGAGIDYIVIDATNLQGYGNYQPGLFTEPTDYLLDEMMVQRNAGNPTPSVVFWVRSEPADSDPAAVGRYIHDRYYSLASYSDFWVTYGGKPLMLTTNLLPAELANSFQLRKQWGLQSSLATEEWSFLQDYPQNVAYRYDGLAEQVSVCTAKQRDYISHKDTATSRQGGQTYANQWSRAFEVQPLTVVLTWWNEWIAQRQDGFNGDGTPNFVDEFDGEFSRDIEPQDPNQPGTHGSKYLDWTTSYVSAYKNGQPMPQGLVGY